MRTIDSEFEIIIQIGGTILADCIGTQSVTVCTEYCHVYFIYYQFGTDIAEKIAIKNNKILRRDLI